MTRKQAADKVAKLRRLAVGAGTREEADAASRAADKIVSEQGLSEAELNTGARAAALDELAGDLERFADKNRDKLPGAVFAAMAQAHEIPEDQKADAMVKIAGGVRVASLLFGQNKDVMKIRKAVDAAMKKHGAKI